MFEPAEKAGPNPGGALALLTDAMGSELMVKCENTIIGNTPNDPELVCTPLTVSVITTAGRLFILKETCLGPVDGGGTV